MATGAAAAGGTHPHRLDLLAGAGQRRLHLPALAAQRRQLRRQRLAAGHRRLQLGLRGAV
jgi:hypothetical protein